jgi:hypothetical protein
MEKFIGSAVNFTSQYLCYYLMESKTNLGKNTNSTKYLTERNLLRNFFYIIAWISKTLNLTGHDNPHST